MVSEVSLMQNHTQVGALHFFQNCPVLSELILYAIHIVQIYHKLISMILALSCSLIYCSLF